MEAIIRLRAATETMSVIFEKGARTFTHWKGTIEIQLANPSCHLTYEEPSTNEKANL